MSNGKIIVGLDIGTTKIAVMVGRVNEYNKIEILGIGKTESLGVKRGAVQNIDQTTQSILQAIEEASTKSGVEIKSVNVGIAGQHIRSMQHRGLRTRQSNEDEISKADIDSLTEDMYKLVMQPGEAIIHALPQEFIIDSEPGIKNPVGMSGMRLEANYHIITGQIAAINNVIKCVKKAGLEVANLTLEPLASAASVLSEDEKEAGVALIDIGGGTTDIAIFQEGIIRHTAVIPFGGDIITKDIKEGCNIIQAQAELLKVKFGSALAIENQDNEIVSIPGLRGREPKEISLKNLANIIQARLEEIIEHAVYEIRNSGFEKKLIAGIVLTGGGSQMRHLVQLTEYISGMDVRIGYPTEHLAGNFDEVKSPMYATGIGLVITESDDMLNRKRSKTENQKQAEASTANSPDEEAVPSQGEEVETEVPHEDEKPNLFERFKKWFGEDIQ